MRLPVFALWTFTAVACAFASARPESSTANPQAQRLLENLPMRFEQNQGQIHPEVRYFSRWGEYTLFLTQRQAVLAVPGGVLRMSLRHGNPHAPIEGVGPLSSRTDVFKGNRPQDWRRNVAQYKRVAYRGVYPGIDVVYYGAGRLLEHDFVVAPGADPKKIRMRFSGADQLRLDGDGGLVFKVGGVELRQPKPYIYQQPAGEVERARVDGRYVLLSKNEVGFDLGGYDRDETLVIDPVLMYSSFVGGVNEDTATAMTIDKKGRIWITGRTFSSDYPVTENNYDVDWNAEADIFITAIDPSIEGRGSVVYSTFIGGTGLDEARAICTDSFGNIYVAGNSGSADFPHAGNAYSIENKGERDAVILKLNPNSSGVDALELATYFGGPASEWPLAITVDERNLSIWIAGYATGAKPTGTTTGNFPFFGDTVQAANRGGYDAFLVNIDPGVAGERSILYSSYFGGSSTDVANTIQIDAQGRLYFGGYTFSWDFPITSSGVIGGGDAFLTVLDFSRPGLDQIYYSSLFGGGGFDAVTALRVDSPETVVATGYTLSTDFPLAGNAAQRTNGGNSDLIVSRINVATGTLLYSTYLGGSGSDVPYGTALDSRGRLWLTGYSTSPNLPVRGDALQRTIGGSWDAFFARLDFAAEGDALTYLSYLGGPAPDVGYGIAVDASGVLYIAGTTSNQNFPIAAGAFAGAYSGNSDNFVMKLTVD